MAHLLAASDGTGFGVAVGFGLVYWVVVALPFMGIFAKAGRPGWAAFVPVYNVLVLLKVVGRPWWWLLLLLVPVVDLVVLVVVLYGLAKRFGHGVPFTLGLILLSWIFLLVLWLGSSRYEEADAVALVADHPAYQERTALSEETRQALLADLEGRTQPLQLG